MRYMQTQFGNINTQLTDIRTSQNAVEERLAMLDNRVKDLTSANYQNENDIREIQDDMNKLRDAQFDLAERTERLVKSSNLILFGIPEDQHAVRLAKEVLNAILPQHELHIRDHRVGQQSAGNTKPRPMRIHLNNQNDVFKALLNCRRLKDVPRLSKISVSRDLTKSQQDERRLNYEQDKNSQQRPQKRVHSGDTIDEPRAKIGRFENVNMEI